MIANVLNLSTVHRKTTGQGHFAHLLVPEPPGDMSHGDGLQTLAYDRVRYQAVEERVAATGSVRAARRFARAAAPDGLGSIRSFAALHRAADRADHAHRAARAGQQVSQLDPYAAGFLNW